MEKVIKFKHALLWINEAGILCLRPINCTVGNKLDLYKSKLYIKAVIKLCDGKPSPFLIDLRDAKGTFSVLAAKELSTNPLLAELRISEAFVTNTIAMKILVNTYKRLFNPLTPFKIFNDMESAIDFCNENKRKFYGDI